MARTTSNRTLFSAACITAAAAVAFAGPFALVGASAAGVNAHAAAAHAPRLNPLSAAASRTRTISATAAAPAEQPASVDDLMAAVPDPSDLGAASAAQSQAAQKIIVAQLDAFRSGAFEQADSYQARSLRASFPDTRQFRIAMSQVYPEFTAYKSVQFGLTRADKSGRFVIVPTTLTGQDGVTVQALYVMVRQSAPAAAASPSYQVLTVLGGMNPHPILDGGMDYQVT